MRSTRIFWTVVFFTALAAPPSFASNVRRGPTASTSGAATHRSTLTTAHSKSKSTTSHTTAASRSHKIKGQQAIDTDRVTQIQQALIREHYMSGDATGNWDTTTIAAMQKYQSDNGWQTKLAPDSRAIKKLGLGPDYSGAINAKDSSFADPPPATSIPNEQAEGFSAASGVNQ